jgi:hypothetical protein
MQHLNIELFFHGDKHYKLVYCNTLTTSMLIKLIIEMLKFSKNMLFKVQNFVKEDRQSITFYFIFYMKI